MLKKYLIFLSLTICFLNVRADESIIENWPNGKKKSEFEMKNGKPK